MTTQERNERLAAMIARVRELNSPNQSNLAATISELAGLAPQLADALEKAQTENQRLVAENKKLRTVVRALDADLYEFNYGERDTIGQQMARAALEGKE